MMCVRACNCLLHHICRRLSLCFGSSNTHFFLKSRRRFRFFYSILALAGDVIAQSLLSEDTEKSFPPADWDKVRTAAFVAFGAIYTGGVSTQI